jgi:type II secretory pathway pseudopilin PulG
MPPAATPCVHDRRGGLKPGGTRPTDELVTCPIRKPQRDWRSEQGSVLIEVLVSAVLVGVMAAALFGSLNSSAKVSGISKARAGAAALAQDEQERMHSMAVSVLSNYRYHPAPIARGRYAYQVDDRADWIKAGASSTDCTSKGGVDYLKITSTVTAINVPQLKPVVIVSQVTPALGTFTDQQGSLGVQVVDRNGKGLPGASVSISGPANAGGTTDDNGCAYFGYEPIGSYTVVASRLGYVDADGNASPSVPSTIASQQVSTQSFRYDLAGTKKINFQTTALGATATVTQPSPQSYLSLSSSDVPGNNASLDPTDWAGYRLFTVSTPASSITATSLFPFANPYSAYAGDCTNNAPPAAAQTPVTVLPGANDQVSVAVPALNLQGQVSGAASNTVTFTIKSTTSGCTSRTWKPAATTARGLVGVLADPGFPYGTYTVCAEAKIGSTTRRTSTVAGTLNATSLQALNVTSASTAGSCP